MHAQNKWNVDRATHDSSANVTAARRRWQACFRHSPPHHMSRPWLLTEIGRGSPESLSIAQMAIFH